MTQPPSPVPTLVVQAFGQHVAQFGAAVQQFSRLTPVPQRRRVQ